MRVVFPGIDAGSAARRSAAGIAVALALACPIPARAAEPSPPQLELPAVGLRVQDLALVINDADPASVELGRYYAERRQIGADRIVHVSFPPGQATISAAQFETVQAALRARVPAAVQAYALAWTLPYRVECMSITSAFAFGFDASFCAEGCKPTAASPYFDSHSNAPFADHRMRPAMLLAGKDLDAAKAMIDRGVRSDNAWPRGTAYLLNTGDRKRNVRAAAYDEVRARLRTAYPIQRVDDNSLEGQPDVMFYFSGVQHVDKLQSNRFVDGAIADHLTSLGGVLIASPQTSALEWLSAGATGSYGTTVEPCNFREKFPDVGVVMGRYLGGETLIEAYWKSVRMPGQGVFVGEPLARPFGGVRIARSGQAVLFRTRLLRPGRYLLQAAPSRIGPFRNMADLTVVSPGARELRVPAGTGRFYRVLPQPAAARRESSDSVNTP